MAKRTIKKPTKSRGRSIRNSSLIGAGKPFTPVKNSAGETQFVKSIQKQAGKTPARPKPNITAKMSFKATGSMKPAVKPTNQVTRIKGINRLQQQAKKSTPPRKAPTIKRGGPKR